MIQCLCLASVVLIAAGASLIPYDRINIDMDILTHVIISVLALGWLSEIWTDRKKIKRKMVLIIFLGYAVWVSITDSTMKFSDSYCRWESITLIAATLAAALFVGGSSGVEQ